MTDSTCSKKSPRVAVSCFGRFHAFYLAEFLQRKTVLTKLLTSHPKFHASNYGVNPDNVVSCIYLEAVRRMWWKMPSVVKNLWNEQAFFHRAYDRFATRALPIESNIFVGFWMTHLCAIQRARDLGMVTIIECCSSHALYRVRTLTEEYAKFGRKFSETHPKTIEQELAEYEQADFVAIPSDYVKRTFMEQGFPEHKLVLNPYGTNLAEFRMEPQTDEVFRVIQCGQVGIRKGVQYLLQAFTELNLPRAELLLVGPITASSSAILPKYQNAPNIKIIGPVPQQELVNYYNQCNLAVLASVEEGLAYVQPQSMACGLPLICTTNTGGENLIREGQEGFVVPVGDVEALKEKILWCYENREACREMGRAARRRVEENFTWDHYGQRALDFYRRIAPR